MNNLAVADIYLKSNKIPKRFKGYKIKYDMIEVLFDLHEGNIDRLALPHGDIPGYNFAEFVNKLKENNIIKKIPEIKYY